MAKVAPNSKGYKGKKTAKTVENGPVKRHGCTDLLCFVLFVGVWAGMIFIAIYGYSNGDPAALVAPYDQFGKACGIDDLSDYPYIYFNKEGDQIQVKDTICLQTCPDNKDATISCAPDYTKTNECSQVTVYPTVIFANKVCLPTNSTDTAVLTSQGLTSLSFIFQAAADLWACWWIIICVGLIGIFVGFVYMLFMRFCPGVVTWGLLVLYELVLVLFGVFCLLETFEFSLVEDITPAALANISPMAIKIVAGVCILVAFISLIVMCIYRTKIRLAVAIFQAAGEFVEDNISTLLLPPFFFLLSLIFYLFWIFDLIYLIGTNQVNSVSGGAAPFGQVAWSSMPEYMFAFMVLALIWNHSFFHALPQYVISSAACFWYFRKAQKHTHPIFLSIWRAFLHTGSIAMGALLVGIVYFAKVIFWPFERCLLSAKDNKEHCCQKYCLQCFRACLLCFEGCIRFIDKHVYVQIAMTSKGFCESTKEAFYLILRNKARFGTIHGLGVIFVFFGQVFITLVTTVAGYFIITIAPYFQQKLFSPITLTVFFFLISLIVGHSFMSIYGVAADAIIHCYAIDDEVHDEWAKFAPESIKKLASRHARERSSSDASDALSQSNYSNLSD